MSRLFVMDRYICDTLREMRTCLETNNFSYLNGLIEETQSLANRMEAGLEYYKSIKWIDGEIAKLKEEKKELEKSIIELKKTDRDLKKEIL